MKWIFRLVGAIAVLVIVAGVSLMFLPTERIAKIATDQLRKTFGRDVSIAGDVNLSFWPVLGVRAAGLEVGNAEWSRQGPLLEAESVDIGVDARSLFSGDIRITLIDAQSPTIRLEQKLDGRVNWRFSPTEGDATDETSSGLASEPAGGTAALSRQVTIEKLIVEDATIVFDTEGRELATYENVDFSLDWPEPTGTATISLGVQPAGQAITVAASIDQFASFVSGEVQKLSAEINAPAGSARFDGRASMAGDVAGQFALSTSDTAAFSDAFGVAGPELPPKLGRSVDLKTELTLTRDMRLALRDLVVDLSGNRLTGAADISLDGVPQINAQLDAGTLDLDLPSEPNGGSGTTSANSDGAGGGTGWPTTPIDAGALSSFNGDIALRAEIIDLGRFSLSETEVVLRNDNARMVFDLRKVQAYGGLVTGEFVVNNRGGLSVGGKMAVNGLQMQPFLSDAIDQNRLTGQGDLSLAFLGVGQSVDAIMNSLSGNGQLSIGRGTIEGINLDQLLRSGNASGGTTIFDNLTASWSIAAGVLNNRDLLFQLKNYEASGQGNVGLGKQTVDYTFTPVALRANSGQGLAIPVRFVGPWSNVSIRPEVEAALDLSLDAEKEKLEQKARDKISEELGINSGDGPSTEDVIKDELENKLLKKLFD